MPGATILLGSEEIGVLVAFAACTVTIWAWVVCTEYALIIRPNAAISRVFLRFIWGFQLCTQFNSRFGSSAAKVYVLRPTTRHRK